MEQADIGWRHTPPAQPVPAHPVDRDDRMHARRHHDADFLQMMAHGPRIGTRRHKARPYSDGLPREMRSFVRQGDSVLRPPPRFSVWRGAVISILLR